MTTTTQFKLRRTSSRTYGRNHRLLPKRKHRFLLQKRCHILLCRVQLIVFLLVRSLCIVNMRKSDVITSMFHIVQVVSMLDVPITVGSVSFQSKEVKGAQNEVLF